MANSELKESQIASELGVSRERIRQLLHALNLPTRIKKYRPCRECGKLFPTKKGKKKAFCSLECRRASVYIKTRCAACGLEFEASKNVLKTKLKLGYKHFFCSRSCSRKFIGKLVGSTHGRKALANNRGTPDKVYNYSGIAYLYNFSPFYGNKEKFIRTLGIPKGSMVYVLKRGEELLNRNGITFVGTRSVLVEEKCRS